MMPIDETPNGGLKTETDIELGIKKKIAPRSGLQFKLGPLFSLTTSILPIYNSKGEEMYPHILARLDRGFELSEDQWIGYKRNYFTSVAAFTFTNLSFEEFLTEKFSVLDPQGNSTNLRCFAIKLTSISLETEEEIRLVQHTAKRDKDKQLSPKIVIAVPGNLPGHEFIKDAANIRSVIKMQNINQIFYCDLNSYSTKKGISLSYPQQHVAKAARFERIQFSTSMSNKRPRCGIKQFKIRVELIGILENEVGIKLAYTETPSIIVRGRSPSNYHMGKNKMNKRTHKDNFIISQIVPGNEDQNQTKLANKDENQFPLILSQEIKELMTRPQSSKLLTYTERPLISKIGNIFIEEHLTTTDKVRENIKNTKTKLKTPNKNTIEINLVNDEIFDGNLLVKRIFYGLPRPPSQEINRNHSKLYGTICDISGYTTDTANSFKGCTSPSAHTSNWERMHHKTDDSSNIFDRNFINWESNYSETSRDIKMNNPELENQKVLFEEYLTTS